MRWTIVLAIFSIGMWIFALSQFTRLPQLTVESVEIVGADPEIENDLRAAAFDVLRGKYLGIFSKSNSFIYPSDSIEDAAGGASSKIITVDAERVGAKKIVLKVVEKTPVAIVCAGLPDWKDSQLIFDSSDQCYRADAGGYLFVKDASSTETSYLGRYYIPGLVENDIEGNGNFIGKYAASTTEFASLRKFYDGAKANGIAARAILVKGDGEYELYADNPPSQLDPGEINPSDTDEIAPLSTIVVYFNDRNNLNDELVNLVSFWKNMEQTARAEGKSFHFESIDLRYGPNVFYRAGR